MKHLSDPALLVLLQEGDPSAFREIYDRYWEVLYRQASKKLGDREDIRDIVQEIFLSLWRGRQVLQVQESLLQYLYTALRYKIIDHYRQREVRVRYYEAVFVTADDSIVPEALGYQELNNLVEAEISAMPPKMKEVFLLSRDEELNAVQIAARLSLSHQTVRNQISTALKRLRARLSAYTAR
ncbi:RNA polymerase sigma-70 factor [Chitinophaga pendula]|uniref:RNA polymerase sigma factor n=1 Tax=Chitinophaga TaxID=79328 RepID=UPI0012FDC610|nr:MULTISPECIES: RNA polymerase sigma-70 factor [Chitinophaga]UCJ08591.1 RNA polymerase sigma-70 factor [Chitinophaga pendula]